MRDWKEYVRQNLSLGDLRPEQEAEIVDDLAHQIEQAFLEACNSGLDEAEAERLACEHIADWQALARELRQTRRGSPEVMDRLEATARDAGSATGPKFLFTRLAQDLVFGLRMIRNNRMFTAAAILTLALGIGANAVIFAVMNATLLKKIPFPDPDRLMLVWKTSSKQPGDYSIVSAPNFWDWQRLNHVFDRMAIFDSAGKGYSLGQEGNRRETEQVSGLRVSADFFNVLGVNPMLGRVFLPEEEIAGKDREVVLSYGLWQRRYAGDRTVVGRQIRLDGEAYTVVGVMPREFEFQFWSDQRELWVPAGWTAGDHGRGSNSFIAIARLKSGVSIAQAQAEMSAIQARLADEYKSEREDNGTGAAVMRIGDYGLETVQRITGMLLGAVAFVLLIGCVNVANLMLARGGERRKEFAVRRALGASAARIVQQLLAESVLLALLGGVAGLALAYWASSLLKGILPTGFSYLPLRRFEGIELDARVLGFTFALTFLTAIVFGLVPALMAVHGDTHDSLKEGGRGSTAGGRRAMRNLLVASEVGLALVVLSAAGLMIKSMGRLMAVDPGFDPANVLVTQLSLPQANTYYGPPLHPRFCQELADRLAPIPGVVSIGAAAHLPMRGMAGRSFYIEGRPIPEASQTPAGTYTVACPGYFRTLRIPVLKGREFTAQDNLGSPAVVIINEAMARKYWPNEDPIGRRIDIDKDGKGNWLTIVGVAANVRSWGLDSDAPRLLVRPYTQAAWPSMQVVIRTNGDISGVGNALKQAMTEVEPDQAITRLTTMEATVRSSVGSRRFPMIVLAAFSALALMLATIGIVGVVSYSVTQRTQEIGIRIALGAQAQSVVRLVLKTALLWVMLGIAAGLAGSLAIGRLLDSLLYDVTPNDPLVLSAVTATLAIASVAAGYAPARQASRVNPLIALRSD